MSIAGALLDEGPGALEVLRIFEFQSDFEARDDALQAEKETEFNRALDVVVERLSTKYGKARMIADGEHAKSIPLNVDRAAIRLTDGKELFAAFSHEDRETPFLLLMGVGAEP